MTYDPTSDEELRRRQLDGIEHLERQADKRAKEAK